MEVDIIRLITACHNDPSSLHAVLLTLGPFTNGTPLHSIVQHANVAAISAILQSHTPATSWITVLDNSKETPVDVARRLGFLDIVACLSSFQLPVEAAKDGQIQGTLSKWTNYKTGFQPRYFHLSHGILRYYKSIHEFPSRCRGFLESVDVTAMDGVKFEVVGVGADGRSGKFSLKAEGVGMAKKWVWALKEAKLVYSSVARPPLKAPLKPSSSHSSIPVSKSLSVVTAPPAIIHPSNTATPSQASSASSAQLSHTITPTASTLEDMIHTLTNQRSLLRSSSEHIESLRLFDLLIDSLSNTLSSFGAPSSNEVIVSQEVIGLESSKDSLNSQSVRSSIGSLDEFYDAMTEIVPGTVLDTTAFSGPQSISLKSKISEDVSVKDAATGYENLPFRATIPPTTKPPLHMWSFLKTSLGKDLSKLTLPVLFNEPLSMLQRMCEDIEYNYLLSIASFVGSGLSGSGSVAEGCIGLGLDMKWLSNFGSEARSSGSSIAKQSQERESEIELLRLVFVTAFAMSNYSSTTDRLTKPFNPVHGETFEFIKDNVGSRVRYISEQVSHHPPISVCHCVCKSRESDVEMWKYESESNIQSQFMGTSLTLSPLGKCIVGLPHCTDPRQESTYTWKKVHTRVSNLILGPLTISHYGDMTIQSSVGMTSTLTFIDNTRGWFTDGNEGQLTGTVKDLEGSVRYTLKGKWNLYLEATNTLTNQTFPIFRATPKPPNLFNMTVFSLSLNQINPELEGKVARTDSRLRPDQMLLEQGEWVDAESRKGGVEQRQRERKGVKPKWFDKVGEEYKYNELNGYWDTRRLGFDRIDFF